MPRTCRWWDPAAGRGVAIDGKSLTTLAVALSVRNDDGGEAPAPRLLTPQVQFFVEAVLEPGLARSARVPTRPRAIMEAAPSMLGRHDDEDHS